MSALPAFPVATGAYRALTVYDAAPDGCGTLLVPDNAFAPHLKAGELAVIDPDDREPVEGEIYVVKISSPVEDCGYRLAIVQLRSSVYEFVATDEKGERYPAPDIGWMMHFQLIRPQPKPKFYPTTEDALRNVSTWTICDGPLRTDGMRRYAIGRVIGVVLAGSRS